MVLPCNTLPGLQSRKLSQCAKTMATTNTAATWGRIRKTTPRPATSNGQFSRRPFPTNPSVASPSPSIMIASFPMLDGQNQIEGKRNTQAQ